VLAAAQDCGIGHVVLLSGVDADVDSPFCYAHTNGVTERWLRGSGMEFSIARATLFDEFFTGLLRQTGFRLPMADGRITLISRAEVAESLARLALSPPTGTHHELTGPQTYTLGSLYGTDVTPAEFIAERARAGEEPWWIYAYASMFESIRQQRWARVTSA
jgi:NAD(P)H dehydrogenase (quinone)